MLPPILCFTCGQTIADKYDYYLSEVKKLEAEAQAKTKTETKAADVAGGAVPKAKGHRHFDGVLTGTIMDKLCLKRYCCRRMMLGIEDMMDVL